MEVLRFLIFQIVLFVNKFGMIGAGGEEQFFIDFLTYLNNESPVFITKDYFEQDFHNTFKENFTASFITYSTDKEAREVARCVNKLFRLGDLTVLVFVGYGHHKLLDCLMNNLKLFKIGLIGLISENDANTARNMTLQLYTRLYVYKSHQDKNLS